MSLVHDLAESIVGDLTPSCGVSREEKHKQEKVSFTFVMRMMVGKDF
jgi:putative hydrolase of HD superfamily